MTRDEYEQRAQAQDDWAPGWEAIDAAFGAVYPGVEPPHLATSMPARAMFGGNEYLDGASLFPSPKDYQHVVTYGMSSLYADAEDYGGERSGWGYEMTMKVVAPGKPEAGWAVSVMSNLARYTYTSGRWFEPYQAVAGNGTPISIGSGSALTSLLVVPDTEVAGVDTVHGRLDFLQLVGVTQPESDWIFADPSLTVGRIRELAAWLAETTGPDLVTDLGRTVSFV